MPKRPNPFGDGSPLQLKSHIGTKEIDLGVNQKDSMQSVYEKTKSMLFQAAKKPVSKEDTGPRSPVEEPVPTRGQLRIDSTGQICAESSKENPTGLLAVCMDQDMDFGFVNNNNVALPAGQMQIDTSGQLCSGVKVPESRMPSFGVLCYTCHRPSPLVMRSCQFCERQQCVPCLRECTSCQGRFCQVCSLINYDAFVERTFCLHCAP